MCWNIYLCTGIHIFVLELIFLYWNIYFCTGTYIFVLPLWATVDKGTLEICPGNTCDQTKHSDLAVMYRRRRRKNKHRIKDTKDFRDRSLFIIIAWGGRRLFLRGGGGVHLISRLTKGGFTECK